MSLILNGLQLVGSILRTNLTTRIAPLRLIHVSFTRFDEEIEESATESKPINPLKDRSRDIPVETSIAYLKSDAYKQTYGDNPVWKLYRRNHKGQFPPKKTRKTCIRNKVVTTGNPCPICRDEYLIIDYRNLDLLKQFISEFNGEIIGYTKTGLCQNRNNRLLVEIHKARDHGLLTFDVPIREYDYSEWYNPEAKPGF